MPNPTLPGRRPFERRQGRTEPEAPDVGEVPPAQPVNDDGLNDQPETPQPEPAKEPQP